MIGGNFMISKLFEDLSKCQKVHEAKNGCDNRFTCDGCQGEKFCEKSCSLLWDMQSLLIKKAIQIKRIN